VTLRALLHSFSVPKWGETWRSPFGPLATNCHQEADAGGTEIARMAPAIRIDKIVCGLRLLRVTTTGASFSFTNRRLPVANLEKLMWEIRCNGQADRKLLLAQIIVQRWQQEVFYKAVPPRSKMTS
jgi:hypothetical protein